MRRIFIILVSVFFIPHYVTYLLCKNRSFIKEDLEEFKRHFPIKVSNYLSFTSMMLDKSYRSVFYYRIGRISRILSIFFRGEDNLLIFSSTRIGGGIYPAHAFSTVINANRIGRNFHFRHLTTIGNKIEGRNDLLPSIGNNVNLGANVTIIGNVQIGDNVMVGAGTVITKDIPSNCTVVGNPARIIMV